MKIIISSAALDRILSEIFGISHPVSKWKITPVGLKFYAQRQQYWIFCPAHAEGSIRSEIKVSDYDVEFPFNESQWKDIGMVLKHFPEQPIVMEFAGSAKELMQNSDTNINIRQCFLTFKARK